MADNINVTKVVDPRMRTDLDNEYIAVIGADNWVKYRFGASALSNTQMAFNNIKPAGEKFMINTRWYIEYTKAKSSSQQTMQVRVRQSSL